MSDVMYPIGNLDLSVTLEDRVVTDEFESGGSSARTYWPAGFFKRRFDIQHDALVKADFEYLQSFHRARGRYDPFWFRDNENRGGNAKVRFASSFNQGKDADRAAYRPSFQLDEIAPIMGMPQIADVIAAAGVVPTAWYDPNREIYMPHGAASNLIIEGDAYDVGQSFPLHWLSLSSNLLYLQETLSQYQTYGFDGFNHAIGTANPTFASNVCSLFIAFKGVPGSGGNGVIMSVGTQGSNSCFGIGMDGVGALIVPFTGTAGGAPWTNCRRAGSSSVFQTIAVTFDASNARMYVNGALFGTDAFTNSFAAGPISIGSKSTGASILDGASPNTNKLGDAMLFAGTVLTLAKIKALHNLVAHRYSLAQVV